MTGLTFDLSLASSEMKGVTITVGDTIDLNAEVASMLVSGSGDIYSMFESNITSITSTINDLQEKTLVRFKVTEVSGLRFTCDVSVYDFETQSLKLLNTTRFNAFMGSIPLMDYIYDKSFDLPTMSTEMAVPSMLSIPLFSPIITPDWDIYNGYMILSDTLISIYLDDFLDLLTASTTITQLDSLIIDGNMEMTEKRKYTYFTQSFGLDVTADLGSLLGDFTPETTISLDAHITVTENGWTGYHEDGFLAGMRTQVDVNVELSSDYGTDTNLVPTGTVTVNLDIKLVNPNYNPPDPTAAGVIPGFTWLVAIPALLGVAAIGLISRRK